MKFKKIKSYAKINLALNVLGKSSKLSKNQRGSQSTTGLGSGIGGSTKKKETKEPHLEGEESSGDKYVDRVHILQL